MIEPVLKKYFVFEKIFNLHKYDHDLSLLYVELLKLKKERYESNYRFIFYYWDIDYFITNNQPGLLLRNLQRLLFHLDISNYFSLIVTQQPIDSHLEQLRIEETCDDVPISCIVTMIHPGTGVEFNQVKNLNVNTQLIKKHYMTLNRVRRFHRTLLYSYLQYLNLLNKGIVSYASR